MRLSKAGNFVGIALIALALRYAPPVQVLEPSNLRKRANALLPVRYSGHGAPR